MSVWLWYPGIGEDRQLKLPEEDLTNPGMDFNMPVTSPRSYIVLPNANWHNEMPKAYNVIAKRAMNNTVRTYVTKDRLGFATYEVSLAYSALTAERREALEHFLLCADGKYLGFKDEVDYYHIAILPEQDITFGAIGVPETYASSGMEGPYPRQDWGSGDRFSVTIKLLVLRHVEL